MRHLSLKITLLVTLALMAMRVGAASVDADAARSCALSFLQSHRQGHLSAPNATLRLAHAEPSAADDGQATYYVFNSEGGDAFVIVAGDDRVAPILGYGNGAFDVERLPCNVRWWFDEYKRQIEWLRAQPEESLVAVAQPKDTPAEDFTVEPMLTCHWDQDRPYNLLCAEYEGELCATGCVATAMAEVMHYWKYPEELPYVPAYTSSTYQIHHEALPGARLDWDNMLDSYSGGYTDEQALAVATLMRYCSQACLMDCSPQGSGSCDINQLLAFKRFGYNASSRYLERDDYTSDTWRTMVNGELQAGHPIPYSGSIESGGGHAFVIDGYSDGLYHVNWGWDGYYDGYFELDILKPYNNYSFSYGQGMNYDVCPNDVNTGTVASDCDLEVDGIYYRIDGDEAVVTSRDFNFNSYSGEVVIPENVVYEGRTCRVTTIGRGAFAGCEGLTSVKMPYIERINSYPFVGSPNLTSLYFGRHFKSTERWAFYGLDALEKIEVEDLNAWASINFPDYYYNPLYYCSHLYHNGMEVTDLVLGDDVPSVGDYAFFYCDGLKNITIEDGVKSIGAQSFSCCLNIEKVSIADAVEHIGYGAFCYDPSLTDVDFKGNVGKIGNYAFYCTSIKDDLVLPVNIDTIGYGAFERNTNLQRVIFPGTVNYILPNAFLGCTRLQRVDVPDLKMWLEIKFGDANANPLQQAHHLYVGDDELTHLVVPPGVDRIHDYAFVGCEGLSNAVIGNNVESIGEQAFKDCNGMSIATLGNKVRTIGEKAFYGCSKLTDFTFGKKVETAEMYAFGSCKALVNITSRAVTPPYLKGKSIFPDKVYNNAIVYVPRQSVDAYKEALVWKYFSIEGVNFMLKNADVNGDGEVNISDVTAVIDILLEGGIDDVGDVNEDDEVNISDINAVVDIILTGN